MIRTLMPIFLALAACGAAPPPAAEPAPEENAVVATWNGGQLTQADVKEEAGGQLDKMEAEYLQQRYDFTRNVIDALVNEQILEAEAKAKGVESVDVLLRNEIEGKVTEPSEAEIVAEFDRVKGQMPGVELEMVRGPIVQQLMRGRMEKAYMAYINELRTASDLKVVLERPEVPRVNVEIAADDPSIGPKDAPITIIEFAEYECPFCGRADDTIQQVLETYEGKVRFVFKDYPLDFHPRARPAAIAAHCAGEQDKYWEMNRVLLRNQKALGDSDFVRFATDLELDMDAWSACLTSGKYDAGIDADMKAAAAAGVQATPTFLVNGILLSGALPFDSFKNIIDAELEG